MQHSNSRISVPIPNGVTVSVRRDQVMIDAMVTLVMDGVRARKDGNYSPRRLAGEVIHSYYDSGNYYNDVLTPENVWRGIPENKIKRLSTGMVEVLD